MTILKYKLMSDSYDEIFTEIRYAIATARANGGELVSFELGIPTDDDSKIFAATAKNLKAMKKEGKIDFFVSGDDFSFGNAEVSYLMNKFSDTIQKIDFEKTRFIIKL